MRFRLRDLFVLQFVAALFGYYLWSLTQPAADYSVCPEYFAIHFTDKGPSSVPGVGIEALVVYLNYYTTERNTSRFGQFDTVYLRRLYTVRVSPPYGQKEVDEAERQARWWLWSWECRTKTQEEIKSIKEKKNTEKQLLHP